MRLFAGRSSPPPPHGHPRHNHKRETQQLEPPVDGSPVGVHVANAGEESEGAPELCVNPVVQQHELPVGRGEAQLPHRLELIQFGALVKVTVLRTNTRQAEQARFGESRQAREFLSCSDPFLVR